MRKGDKRILFRLKPLHVRLAGRLPCTPLMPGSWRKECPSATGIDIGQIQKLTLITARNEVQATAVLYPEYVQTFARSGTRFSVVTPQISAAGVEHLDTILQPYINVERPW